MHRIPRLGEWRVWQSDSDRYGEGVVALRICRASRQVGWRKQTPKTAIETRLALTGLLMMWSAYASVGTFDDRVENFELLDHAGTAHELYYFGDVSLVVLMSHSRRCADDRARVAALDSLGKRYRGDEVEFLVIDGSGGVDRTPEWTGDAETPILIDDAQIVTSSLGITETGEALVIVPESWRIVWRGALEGLAPVLDAILDDERPMPPTRDTAVDRGCPITFREDAVQSYVGRIAPILIDKCVPCHRRGGIGPWAMTSHKMVLGFSPMMREVIRTRRMPPWGADPAYGEFSNDRSLSIAETRDLVRWIEHGSPRDHGRDPLMRVDADRAEWALGEPDLVIHLPSFEVPASGVVRYRYHRVVSPLERDVWLKAIELNPGDRQAVHHVLTLFMGDVGERKRGPFGGARWLDVYTPGTVARPLPEGTGALLPAGATITFQVHYTPYGKESMDRSRLGLYFHTVPPKRELASSVLINKEIRIPPYEPAHSERASHVFDRDVVVYALLPHAHYRGKAANFVAEYPDGRREVLLSVPSYDFNWQTTYRLREPKRIAAGTRVVLTMVWDNSSRNPMNPDPRREVGWGLQSSDEMLFGVVTWAYLDRQKL